MEIVITRRVDGSKRIGTRTEKHHATGLTYGNDEIDAEETIEIPEAYETDFAVAYTDKNGFSHPIEDHPTIKRAMKNL